jgi:hypothetical protein
LLRKFQPIIALSISLNLVLRLKNQLATLITSTHDTPITYDQVWTVLQVSDLDPTNSAKVLCWLTVIMMLMEMFSMIVHVLKQITVDQAVNGTVSIPSQNR